MSLCGVSGEHSVESASVRPQTLPRVFDGRPLEAVTDAEVRDAAFARDLRPPASCRACPRSEPARNQDAVGAFEQLLAVGLLERFASTHLMSTFN